MAHSSKKVGHLLLTSLAITALLPRCSCEEGDGIQRANVEMALTFIEEDSCSGTPVPRRIPDDYLMTMQPQSTDLGSRGERRFEVRSIGLAPLTVREVLLEPADDEYTIELVDAGDVPLTLPLQIQANANRNVPPGLVIKVNYTAQDAEPDQIELVVRTTTRTARRSALV